MDVKKEFNPYQAKSSVIFHRIKVFFLGKETPKLFTRINCNLGIVYLLYIFFWALIVFIALKSGKNLPNAEAWKKIFISIGSKYRIPDIQLAFTSYLIALLIASVLLFFGIILTWRKRISGYYFMFTGIGIAMTSALILMGIDYVQNESGWWEFAIGGLITVLFLIDYMIFKKSL